MARKSTSKSARSAARKAKPRAKAAPRSAASASSATLRPGSARSIQDGEGADAGTGLRAATSANARMALDVISAAIESTTKVRKLQFEGEEEARSMQKKAVRHAQPRRAIRNR